MEELKLQYTQRPLLNAIIAVYDQHSSNLAARLEKLTSASAESLEGASVAHHHSKNFNSVFSAWFLLYILPFLAVPIVMLSGILVFLARKRLAPPSVIMSDFTLPTLHSTTSSSNYSDYETSKLNNNLYASCSSVYCSSSYASTAAATVRRPAAAAVKMCNLFRQSSTAATVNHHHRRYTVADETVMLRDLEDASCIKMNDLKHVDVVN